MVKRSPIGFLLNWLRESQNSFLKKFEININLVNSRNILGFKAQDARCEEYINILIP